MGKLWSFEPTDPRKERPKRVYREKRTPNAWVAPEHAKVASGMERDYPRDDWGKRIEGTEKFLKIDKRPSILVPPRPTYPGFL